MMMDISHVLMIKDARDRYITTDTTSVCQFTSPAVPINTQLHSYYVHNGNECSLTSALNETDMVVLND